MLNNTTGKFWLVEYNLTGLTTFANGFSAAAGTGTMTYDDVGTEDPIPLDGKTSGGSVFNFFADGFRLDGDDMTAVGRGWVESNSHHVSSGANDWLVTATQVEEFDIPEPASAVLLVLALTPLVCLRRRS